MEGGDVDLLFTNLDEALTLLRDDTAMFNGYIVVDLLGKEQPIWCRCSRRSKSQRPDTNTA